MKVTGGYRLQNSPGKIVASRVLPKEGYQGKQHLRQCAGTGSGMAKHALKRMVYNIIQSVRLNVEDGFMVLGMVRYR